MDDPYCYDHNNNAFNWSSKKEFVDDYNNYNRSAGNITDLVCGDDAFKCVANTDPSKQEQCNSYLFKHECDAQDSICKWQDSDLGGIIKLDYIDYLCYSDDLIDNNNNNIIWNFKAVGDKVLNLSIGNEKDF